VCQRGELGAQDQVNGIVSAVIVVQLGARGYQPHRRRPGLTGIAEADLALATQPGVGIYRIVGSGWLRETQVLQCSGDVSGLTAPPAGVQDVDFGIGEFGRCDVDHRAARHRSAQVRLCWIRLRWRRVARRRLMDFRRAGEGDGPHHRARHQQHDQ
jgi:hypothetical protein